MLKKIGLVCITTIVAMLVGVGGSSLINEVYAEGTENVPIIASEPTSTSSINISIPLDKKTKISMNGVSQVNGLPDGIMSEIYTINNLSFKDIQGWTYQDFFEEYMLEKHMSDTSAVDALKIASHLINGIINSEVALEKLKVFLPNLGFTTAEQVQVWVDRSFSPYIGKSIQEEELMTLMNAPIEIIDNPDSPGELKVKNPLVYNFVDNNVHVKIHYIYSDGTPALEDRNLTSYKKDTSVTVDSPIIDGYESDQKVINVTFTTEGLTEYTVTYYNPREIPQIGEQVTVHYADESGNEIADDVALFGNIGESYISEQKNIPGYTFKEARGNTSGIFSKEAQEITYVYSKDHTKGTNVIVHYKDEQGNKLSEDEVLKGHIGKEYSTNKKEILGYQFKEVQGNITGVFEDEAQEVTYIYKKDLVVNTNVRNKEKSKKTETTSVTSYYTFSSSKSESTHWYDEHQNRYLPSTGEEISIGVTILGLVLLGGVGTIYFHKK